MSFEEEEKLKGAAKKLGYLFGTMLRTEIPHIGLHIGHNTIRYCEMRQKLIADCLGTDGNFYRNITIFDPATTTWASIVKNSKWNWR